MITGSTGIGNGKVIVSVDHDPAVVATDVAKGSLLIEESTGKTFCKDDDGATTNVTDLTAGGGGGGDLLANGSVPMTAGWDFGNQILSGLAGLRPETNAGEEIGSEPLTWGKVWTRNLQADIGATLTLLTGAGDSAFSIADGSFVMNEDGKDINLRVEGLSDIGLFRADAGLDRVAMGVAGSIGGAKLHVKQPSATGAQSVIILEQLDLSEEFIRFSAPSIATGQSIEAVGAKTLTPTHFLKVQLFPGSLIRYLEVGTIA